MKKSIIIDMVKVKIGPMIGMLVVFSAIIAFFNMWIGVPAIILSVGLGVYTYINIHKRFSIWEKYVETMTDEISSYVKASMGNHPMAIAFVDETNHVIWYNQQLSEITKKDGLLYSKIERLVPELNLEDFFLSKEEKQTRLSIINGHTYRAIINKLDFSGNKTGVIYFLDVTNYENLKKLYNEERSCCIYVNVDNYDELMNKSSEEKRSILSSNIENLIRKWAIDMEASTTRYDDDKFFIVLENKYLQQLEENKFSILNDARKIETEADFPVSLTMGVGMGGKNILTTDRYANAALDLALGRGGDQAVVKKINKTSYYGGHLQTLEKRNKGQSRLMVYALLRLIEQSSNVIIMGHKVPDMDAVGAALGVYRMAAKVGKEANIVITESNDSISNMFNIVKESNPDIIISCEKAMTKVTENTLLIVVDTHRPDYTECPILLEKIDKVVVIDHHRKSEDSISHALLSYMEPYASSTSELVSEMLQYITGEKRELELYEVDALLAGITVDTKNFSIRTGVRTFEAASWLKKIGADTGAVRQLFQNDPKAFKLKVETILNAQIIHENIAISRCTETMENLNLIVAQAADELLNMRGTNASFVLGALEENQVIVSARSIGDLNVQFIMETLGGGGHLSMAGAQLNMNIDEAEKVVIKAINEHIEKYKLS